MKIDIMNQSRPLPNGYQSRMRINTIQLLSWNVVWVGTCALMKFGPRFLWNQARLFTLLAVGINFCVGIGLIFANRKYVATLDELQQKIFLNALAITIGVVLIVGVPYSVLDTYRFISFHADISDLLMLMALTFWASFLHGTWRYR